MSSDEYTGGNRAGPGSTGAAGFVASLFDHDDYLRGLVWAVVRDSNVVDDIMQLSYERAYRSIDRFDGRSSLRSWLHTICYRTAIDHIRHESRRPKVSLEVVGVDPPVAGDGAAVADGGRLDDGVLDGMEAVDLLGRLDPEQRGLLYFTAALGYSYDEVAEISGLSRGTVASKVSRAKDRLRTGGRP
ncbi:MAG: RNA polymerase sigma factor [Actinomycetota bacterium]